MACICAYKTCQKNTADHRPPMLNDPPRHCAARPPRRKSPLADNHKSVEDRCQITRAFSRMSCHPQSRDYAWFITYLLILHFDVTYIGEVNLQILWSKKAFVDQKETCKIKINNASSYLSYQMRFIRSFVIFLMVLRRRKKDAIYILEKKILKTNK